MRNAVNSLKEKAAVQLLTLWDPVQSHVVVTWPQAEKWWIIFPSCTSIMLKWRKCSLPGIFYKSWLGKYAKNNCHDVFLESCLEHCYWFSNVWVFFWYKNVVIRLKRRGQQANEGKEANNLLRLHEGSSSIS